MSLSEQQHQELTVEFQNRLLAGERFNSITQARQVAAGAIGQPVRPGSELAKETENAIEQSLVRGAKSIIKQGQQEGRPPLDTFEQLVDLYDRQPRLGTRSSTSVMRQQYSTPMPLGYLASQLAGIDGETQVFEPTAGHGSLLLEADPKKATVNEIDDDRAADLRRQGYTVSQADAADLAENGPEPRSQDAVILNPPFGRRRKDGRAERFQIGTEQTPVQTSQLDHVIAWRSLEAMKDDGRAVLLIQGVKNGSESYRSDQYNTQQNRGFYLNLYRNYNVSDHFTLDGSLYTNQGAGFPVDVITIDGRGSSDRPLPAASVPRQHNSYDELKEKIRDLPQRNPDPNLSLLQESNGLESAPEGGARAAANSPGQPLLGDRARGSEPDSELRGVPGSFGEPGQLDDSELDGRAIDGDARGASDAGRDAGGDPAVFPSNAGRSDSAGLGTGTGGKPVDEQSLGSGDSAGVPDSDGVRSSRSGLDYDGDSGEVSRRVDAGIRQGIETAETIASTAEENERYRNDKGGIMVDGNQQQQQQQPEQQAMSQIPYEPRSSGMRLDTLIPRNMGSAVQSALDDVEGRVGNLDEFVSQKLNYSSVEAMHEVLAAEQVDGVALAIDNIEHGTGTLIGDQTGVGKGRQAAALIRYAKETDRTPVFVTRDANLYADMIRDLEDIGVSGFKPFITNSQETIPLEDGREIKTTKNTHSAELDRLMQQGGISPEDGYDGVFTTYSQLQTVRGKETPRREFVNMIAPQSLIIMDEAHMAGGSPQSENSRKSPNARPNRAEFARQLVDRADGIAFSSATAIKRPDVMDLYGRRSGMKDALGSIGELQSALEAGGTPLQQVSTNMLAKDGFYTRRERSYAGVDFGIQSVDVDRESTDRLSQIMGSIISFDRAKQGAIDDLGDSLKSEAKKVGEDNAIGSAGVSSTNFTSLMHNVMDQSLLSRKADQMADEAIDSLERGESPILAVSNTMGSFIEDFAKYNDIKPGDDINAEFGDILMRYLHRSRDVLESDYDGTKTRRPLTDDELGPDAVEAFEKAAELIEDSDLTFPVSPIDRIKQRVEEAGYSFGEITGRNARINYSSDGQATYERRPGRETSKAAKVENTNRFNSGEMDVLLLNRSGSTGISLHASAKFANQRKRHMIVGQAERNVNDFMQTLGRAHRTGQVVPPKISLLMGDTPDEKRPAALLERKMSSLNANTTADKKSGFDTSEIPDFFNQYGDAVVEQILSEYPEINEKLDYPITVSGDGVGSVEDATEGAIAKVTGRLPLLTVNEQEAFYGVLEEEYTSFVDQQNALGNNVLEAEAVDLDARSLAQSPVIARKDGVTSAFGSGVNVEIMDVKAQSYAKTQLEVINEVRQNLDLDPVDSVEEHDPEFVDQVSQDYSRALLDKMGQAANRYLDQQQEKAQRTTPDPERRQSIINRDTKRLNEQKQKVSQIGRLRLGQTVRLDPGEGRIFYGAVTGIQKRGQSLDDALGGDASQEEGKEGSDSFGSTNPIAPSKWELKISLADSSREIPLPLSKVNGKSMGAVDVTPAKKSMMGDDVMPLFDKRQTGQREVRQAFRGNLLRATERYGKKGSVINATVSGQGVEPMLLLPAGYDVQKQIENAPVRLPLARNVRQFMEITNDEGIVKTSDEKITLKSSPVDDEYLLQTGRNQKDIYFDSDLMAVTGDEFRSVSDRMEVAFPKDRLEEVAHYIQNGMDEGRGKGLDAASHLNQARELVGEKLPEFSWSDSVSQVVEELGLPPSVDLSNVGAMDAMRKRMEEALSEADEPDPVGDPGEPVADAAGEETANEVELAGDADPVEVEGSEPGEAVAEEYGESEVGESPAGDVEPGDESATESEPLGAGDSASGESESVGEPTGDVEPVPELASDGVFGGDPDGEAEPVPVPEPEPVGEAVGEPAGDVELEETRIESGMEPVGNQSGQSGDSQQPLTGRLERIEELVRQAQGLADEGNLLRLEVDDSSIEQMPDMESNLQANPEGGEPQFELFDPEDIRFADGAAQVLAGVDGSSGQLENFWIDISDPENQLQQAIDQARPLSEEFNFLTEDSVPQAGESEQSGAYRIDPDGPTTIDTERARLLQESEENSLITGDADPRSIDQANNTVARDDELERLADDYGDDARISFLDPDEQAAAFSVQEQEPSQPDQGSAGVGESPPPAEPIAEEAGNRVGGWHDQSGRPEKNVGQLLEDAGLSEAVMSDSEFYLKVENEPFIPLSIERHSEELIFYHTLVENGDAFIDSEMIFDLSDDGTLSLSSPRENGVPDRSFANMFASNLRKQGFAEAAQKQLSGQQQPEPENESVQVAKPEPEGAEPEPEGATISKFKIGEGIEVDTRSDRFQLGLERHDDGTGVLTTEPTPGAKVPIALSKGTVEMFDAAVMNAGAIERQEDSVAASEWLDGVMPGIVEDSVADGTSPEALETAVEVIGGGLKRVYNGEYPDFEATASPESPEVSPREAAEEETTEADASAEEREGLGLKRFDDRARDIDGAILTTEVSGAAVPIPLSQSTVEMFDAAVMNAGAIERERGAEAASEWLDGVMPGIVEDSVLASTPEEMEAAVEVIGRGLKRVYDGEYPDVEDALNIDDLNGLDTDELSSVPEPEQPGSVEDLLEQRPDLFSAQPDSVLDGMADGPENVFLDGEVGYVRSRSDDQLYQYRTEAVVEAMPGEGQSDQLDSEAGEPEPEIDELSASGPNQEPPATPSEWVEGNPDDLLAPGPQNQGGEVPPPGTPGRWAEGAEGSAAGDGAAAEPPAAEPAEEFDYQETLQSLRSTADQLPEGQREPILAAIKQTEAKMAGQSEGTVQGSQDAAHAEKPQQPQQPAGKLRDSSQVAQAVVSDQDPAINDQINDGAGTGVPSVEEFRDWYRKASVLGQSPDVLAEIAEAGKQAKAGVLQAENYSAENMASDREAYAEQAAIAADISPAAVRFFEEARKAGIVQEDAGGAVAEGKNYRIELTPDGDSGSTIMSVENKQTGGKLSFSDEGFSELGGLTDDDRRRWQRLGDRSAADLRRQAAPAQPQSRPQPPARRQQPSEAAELA